MENRCTWRDSELIFIAICTFNNSEKYKVFDKKMQVLFYRAGSANRMSKYVKKGHRTITELSTETHRYILIPYAPYNTFKAH